MNPMKLLEIAASVSRLKKDSRTYFHGAVCVRNDGVLVAAQNGAPKFPDRMHHSEYRVLRKAGLYSVMYVARTLADGTWADSSPCTSCRKAIKSAKVSSVYYTEGPGTYRVWSP